MVNGFNIIAGNVQAERASIILQMLNFPCAWNGNNIIPLAHHPGEGQLCQGTAVFTRYILQLAEQLLVFLHGFFLEARKIATKIIIGEAGLIRNFPGQKSTA